MALREHNAALNSWHTLLHTLTQMVDYVHFTASRDTFNMYIAPKVQEIIRLMSVIDSPDSDNDMGTDLALVLAPYGWNGIIFERAVSAVSLLAALKSFKVVSERPLGRGAFATVKLAKSLLTGNYIVHKHVLLDTPEHGVPVHVLRELALMKTMRHPHILRLYDVLHRESDVVLTLEFLDCSLREVIQEHGPLPLHVVKSYCHQMLQGLAYAKRKRIMHRDLKPANILVIPQKGVVKIADFGLARVHNLKGERYTRQVMTLRYRAPEIMLGVKTYNASVDMWSIGCMLAEMATSKTTFQGDCEIDQLMKIFCILGTPTIQDWPGIQAAEDWHTDFPNWPKPESLHHLAPELDPLGVDLLSRLLEYNPATRITAEEALRHPWFQDVLLPDM